MTRTQAPSWAELEVGKGPAPRTLAPLTRTDFVRYQGASGDMNPIHHDETFARDAGFPGPVSVGMFQAGVLHAWVAAWLGPENVRRVGIRWQEPLFAGDVLTLSASVEKKYDRDGERRVDVRVTATKSDGKTAVTGQATYVVPG